MKFPNLSHKFFLILIENVSDATNIDLLLGDIEDVIKNMSQFRYNTQINKKKCDTACQ